MAERNRSEATKQRILDAAHSIFAELGYERATVRGIAEAATIQASLVRRYFGSKEALFLAAVNFDLRLPDLRSTPASKRGEHLVRHFLEVWEHGNTASELPALLRIALSHPKGRSRMEKVFREQLEPLLERMEPTGEAARRAALISTQVLGLALTRYVLRLPAVVALSQDDIVTEVGAALQAYLGQKGRRA